MVAVYPLGWHGRTIDPTRSAFAQPHHQSTCTKRPTVQPVTLAEAVLHLRLDPAAATGPEAPLLSSMILAATRMLEQYAHSAVMSQEWQITLHHWPVISQGLKLPRPPFDQLLSVTIHGDPVALSSFVIEYDDRFRSTMYPADSMWPLAGVYWDHEIGGSIWDGGGSEWDRQPTPGRAFVRMPITVTYRCGVATPDDVAPDIKQALLMAIATWYENRESLQQFTLTPMLEIGWQALLEPYREVGFA